MVEIHDSGGSMEAVAVAAVMLGAEGLDRPIQSSSGAAQMALVDK